MSPNNLLDKIVSLGKRRGFIYPASEIYGGLAGFWDYGPLGVELKNNLKQWWWRTFIGERKEIYGLDAAIVMPSRVWEASGHLATFSDPLESGEQFNVMFKTQVGALEPQTAFLRPETAQGIFTNFKNVVDSFHPVLPFGLGQIGKAFRNEIAPRDFIFRAREFEQMEVEYFIRPENWEEEFEKWRQLIWRWFDLIGLSRESVHELEVPEKERAHYSKRTIDFEYDFPFGRKELCGLAYRGDYDLARHQEYSKQDLTYLDEQTGQRILPHVIEPSFGLDRLILAILVSAYHEDGKRVFLKLASSLAPVKVAVSPLLKNKPALVEKARAIFQSLKLPAIFDDNGNIGKRYYRQDEIGTPLCVTVDFQTLDDDTVTLRARDTGEQKRVSVAELSHHLTN